LPAAFHGFPRAGFEFAMLELMHDPMVSFCPLVSFGISLSS
jgi:hypothetical protein